MALTQREPAADPPVWSSARHQTDTVLDTDFALAVWHRRKWLAIVVFAVSLAGAATLVLSLPNLYRANATVLVERQQVSEAFVRPSVTTELETRIQTIHRQVTSRARLAEVITRFNLYPELRGEVPMEAIVNRMRRDIGNLSLNGVEQMGGRMTTIAFTLGYTGRDPDVVADVANALVTSYVDENTKSRERQAVRTAEFLKAQLDEVKQELDGYQQREREFTARHTNELPQQVEVNLAALDRLTTQLRLNGEYQLRLLERRERLEQQLASSDGAEHPAPPLADTPAGQLVKLKEELTALRGKFSDRYPDVIRMQREIAALERRAAQNGGGERPAAPAAAAGARVAAERALAHLQNELASLREEEGTLRRLVAEYESRIENAPRRRDELRQLSRDYESTKERYETLLKRYEEAKVAESLEQGQNVEQFRVLDPAIPPMSPIAPNTLWLLAMAFAGSLALAFGAVVAAERVDTTFHSVDELRAFVAGPSVAVIRRIPTRSAARALRLRHALAVLAVVAGLAVVVAAARYVGAGNEQLVRMTARAQQ